MHKIIFTVLFVLGFSSFISAQNQDVKVNIEGLNKLQKEVQKNEKERIKRINNFIEKSGGTTEIFEMNGKSTIIEDVVNGVPVYRSVNNRGAAITTGAAELKPGGSMGLNLTGDGFKVHVWDGGSVRPTHQELNGRIINFDAVDNSNHATHVTGTIIASGVNANAEGMATNAIAECYDFGGDSNEMINAAGNGAILSNHSYGTLTGWDGGSWFGDDNISTAEDWKFGFYDSRARTWDQIAYNAPYYLIVKSSGNDRSDSGDGTHPPDGPYDCIGTYGVAKNILTIGAVLKIGTGYNQPSDVVQSSFSSWGPADDGRIKPDLVGAGVSIFSTLAGNDTDYGSMQGTSMSTPNVTGSLILVQEAYNNVHGEYMKSATLKALAIHTANEAGPADGPDYQNGWGLLNASGAVEHILQADGVNKQIIEDNLVNGQVIQYELTPVPNTNIKATLVWTDVAGNPVSAQLDPSNPMLVNNLDLRIVDEGGNEQFPYVLDPMNPAFAATKADNNVDNVEVVNFPNPEPRKYFVQVSHKGTIINGSQDFSVIIEYTSEQGGLTNLHWIGDTGNWSDGSNWSLTSGGAPAGLTPTEEYRVVFDENSFSGNNRTSSVDGSYTVGGIIWFADNIASIDLQSNELVSLGDVLLDSDKLTCSNGTLILSSSVENRDFEARLTGMSSDAFGITFPDTNAGNWIIGNGSFDLDFLNVKNGNITLLSGESNIGELILEGGSFDYSNQSIYGMRNLDMTADATIIDDASILVFDSTDPAEVNVSDRSLNSIMQFLDSPASVTGNNLNLFSVSSNNQLTFTSDIFTEDLLLDGAFELIVAAGSTLTIGDNLDLTNGDETAVLRTSEDGTQATLFIDSHRKLCFDNLEVKDLIALGNSSLNAGLNSTLENSDNWFTIACQDLLFADFEIVPSCEDSRAVFRDISSGGVASRNWFINGNEVSDQEEFVYHLNYQISIPVRLEIEGTGGENLAYETDYILQENPLDANAILSNATDLISEEKSPSGIYTWYRNDEIVEGEEGRVFKHGSIDAKYYVVIYDTLTNCNRQSAAHFIGPVSVDDVELDGLVDIYPNPSTDHLFLEFKDLNANISLEIVNVLGVKINQMPISKNEKFVRIATSQMDPGNYFIRLNVDGKIYSKHIIIL